MSNPAPALQVPGVVGVETPSSAPATPTIATTTGGNSVYSLLTNKSFQVFIFCICVVTALTVLLALNVLTIPVGLPLLTTVVGFMIGVPVQPKD